MKEINNIFYNCEKLVNLNPNYFVFEESTKSKSLYLKVFDSDDKYKRSLIYTLRFSDHSHPINSKGYLFFDYWSSLSFEEFKYETRKYLLERFDDYCYYGDLDRKDIEAVLSKIL